MVTAIGAVMLQLPAIAQGASSATDAAGQVQSALQLAQRLATDPTADADPSTAMTQIVGAAIAAGAPAQADTPASPRGDTVPHAVTSHTETRSAGTGTIAPRAPRVPVHAPIRARLSAHSLPHPAPARSNHQRAQRAQSAARGDPLSNAVVPSWDPAALPVGSDLAAQFETALAAVTNDWNAIQADATSAGANIPGLGPMLPSGPTSLAVVGTGASAPIPVFPAARHANSRRRTASSPAAPPRRSEPHRTPAILDAAAVDVTRSAPGFTPATGTPRRPTTLVARGATHRRREPRAAASSATAPSAWIPHVQIALDSAGSAAGVGGGVGVGTTAMALFMAFGLGLRQLFSSRLSLELEPWRSAVFPSRLERPG